MEAEFLQACMNERSSNAMKVSLQRVLDITVAPIS
jgi:hypothetical protein